MAIRCYLRDTDVDATCNVGTLDFDLSTTQGTTTTQQISSVGNSSYTHAASYMIDLSADSTVLHGSQTYNLSISINSVSNTNWRCRLRSVDTTGCSRTNSSGYQTFAGGETGTQTFSLTLNHPTTDEHIELDIETQQTAPHGTRRVTLDVNDVNSWVDVPQATPQTEPLYRTMRTLLERRGRITALDADLTHTNVFTIETYIIDPGNGPGTDYLSLADFQSAKAQDLVDENKLIYAFCRSTDGSEDVGNASFSGPWNTGPNNFLVIKGIEDHGGQWNDNNYRIRYTSGGGALSFPSAGNCMWAQVINLQIENTNSSGSGVAFSQSAAGTTHTVRRCIIRNTNASPGASAHGIQCNGASTRNYDLANNIIYGFNEGVEAASGATVTAYHNTVDDCAIGFETDSSGTFLAVNSLISRCPTPLSGTFNNSTRNNVTDATLIGPSNYRPGPGSAAIGAAEDLSADALLPVTTDQTGTLRLGAIDVGALQSHPQEIHSRRFLAVTQPAVDLEFELHRVRQALLHRAARISAADLDLTYDLKTGRITAADIDATYDLKTGRVTAADIDLTYDLKTGRITAADVDATYDLKTGRITAADLDLTYDLKTGRVTAADLDITYALKTGRVTAADLDLTYTTTESGIEFVLARTRQTLLARIGRISGTDIDLTYDLKTGRVTAADVDVTYDLKTGRITATDIDATYDLKTGRVTAADLDLTYSLKTGRVTATDIDLTYSLKTGRVTAADLDLTYALKTGRITAADLDLTYETTESGIEFVLARARQALLHRQARVSAVDVDITHTLKTGRITAADLDLTYALKTGRVTAADLDLTYTTTASGIEFVLARTRQALLYRAGRVTGLDVDIEHDLKTGRVTAADLDLTYSLKTGRVTAADVDVVYAAKAGRITALDIDLIHEVKTGRVTAVDADLVYDVKTGRITAIDADIVYFNQKGRITAMDVVVTYSEAAVVDDSRVRIAAREGRLVWSRPQRQVQPGAVPIIRRPRIK
jgi:hypothetical protein